MGYYNLGLAIPQKHAFIHHRVGVAIGALEGSSGIAGTGVFSDVKGAIDEINRQIHAMEIEMAPQLAASPNLATWYHTVWTPWLKTWSDWSDEHSHWYHNMFLSSWHEANDFAEQLKSLHESAQSYGYTFIGPAPSGGAHDAFEKAGKQLWSMIKILIYAGAIIVGIVFVSRFA